MIGELYEALAAVLAVWADKSTARYKPAADGFSFDAEPRADLTAYYVEPAQTRQAAGYVGGGGLDVAMVTIWASLEARDDPAAAGLALANDLQRLRAAIPVSRLTPTGIQVSRSSAYRDPGIPL